jgi:hypothetical protein
VVSYVSKENRPRRWEISYEQKVTHGKFGYLDLTINHTFRRFKVNRQYDSRKQILVKEQLEPGTLVYPNADDVREFHNTVQM